MKKLWFSVLTVAVIAIGVFGVVSAEPDPVEKSELTEEQQEEMASLQNEVLEKEKEIIQKYVDFGVISKEKGDHVISYLVKHYEKLEANGFVPNWDQKHEKKDDREGHNEE
ncbi:YckD family protein [Piscibacillus salipiscarius]|uniref:YckD family protein n=1 Tax=Piscibacillus salipiscarius TaxID=299480 RepID=A0ABW5QC69_9BACI|nr:YckD family protein [Piscibacillus salipiscarius]